VVEDGGMDIIDAAEDFVWRTARLVDRLRFEHLFRGGSPERVVLPGRSYVHNTFAVEASSNSTLCASGTR